jgi:sulfoxide reductase heme-binding subunit YedZ
VSKSGDGFTLSEIGLFALGSVVGALLGIWALYSAILAMAAGSPAFWFTSRAAGIVSYLVLWGSTAWGIMLSSKGVGGFRSGPLAFALHNITSWLALGFAMLHGLSLLGDTVVPFTAAGVLIPFAANYQTLLSGLGTLSLYLGVIVTAAFYWKKRIGYRAWRVIHAFSYLMFVLVTVHGIMLGTDSGTRIMQFVYLAATGSVLYLTLFRVLTIGSDGSKPTPAGKVVLSGSSPRLR